MLSAAFTAVARSNQGLHWSTVVGGRGRVPEHWRSTVGRGGLRGSTGLPNHPAGHRPAVVGGSESAMVNTGTD